MGKKVNPRIFRMGLSEQWRSRWFSDKDFAKFLQQDTLIRRYINKTLREAGIDRVEIERNRGEITVNVSAAKPGLIIGRGGSGIEELKKTISRKFLGQGTKVSINITEVSVPSLSASVIVENMRQDIEKRIPFRRVMKQSIDKVMKAGAKGVRIIVSGRLNGSEIARREKLVQGSIPLHTLRANIDYSRGAANTIYGAIGLKVWIYKGQYFDKKAKDEKKESIPQAVSLFNKEKHKIQPIDRPHRVKSQRSKVERKKSVVKEQSK